LNQSSFLLLVYFLLIRGIIACLLTTASLLKVKILLDLYLKYMIGSLTVFTPLNRSNVAFLNDNFSYGFSKIVLFILFYYYIICLIYTILGSGKLLLLYRVYIVSENNFSEDPITIKRLIDICSFKNTRILWYYFVALQPIFVKVLLWKLL
jgi:hypothetical protein